LREMSKLINILISSRMDELPKDLAFSGMVRVP